MGDECDRHYRCPPDCFRGAAYEAAVMRERYGREIDVLAKPPLPDMWEYQKQVDRAMTNLMEMSAMAPPSLLIPKNFSQLQAKEETKTMKTPIETLLDVLKDAEAREKGAETEFDYRTGCLSTAKEVHGRAAAAHKEAMKRVKDTKAALMKLGYEPVTEEKWV